MRNLLLNWNCHVIEAELKRPQPAIDDFYLYLFHHFLFLSLSLHLHLFPYIFFFEKFTFFISYFSPVV